MKEPKGDVAAYLWTLSITKTTFSFQMPVCSLDLPLCSMPTPQLKYNTHCD